MIDEWEIDTTKKLLRARKQLAMHQHRSFGDGVSFAKAVYLFENDKQIHTKTNSRTTTVATMVGGSTLDVLSGHGWMMKKWEFACLMQFCNGDEEKL
jgi:hypothetical protein